MELYTTEDIIRSLAATVAPYIFIPLLTALICSIFPNLPKNILR